MSERAESVSFQRRLTLAIEFVAIFGALPVIFYLRLLPFDVLVTLWSVAGFCLWILWRDPSFERRTLWHMKAWRLEMPRVLGLFLLGAATLTLLVLAMRPDLVLGFVRQRPWLWALVMLLYPLLSVYPQGVVFRVFLFHRYRPLFVTGSARITASCLAFGYMHIVFDNWVAMVLTLTGGLLFAITYHRTRSAPLAALEHALYGCFVITLGLGRFIYSGG